MVIDSEKVKRRAKPSIVARPVSKIRIGRQMPPSVMRKRSEFFRLFFGVMLLVAFAFGCAVLAWSLVKQSTEYAKIRAEQEYQKEKANEVSPVSMPITYKPSSK